MLELRVLGPLEVVEDGRARSIGSSRQRDLLALLIVHANEPVATERILDELWGDEPPDAGPRAVAFHVAKLRDLLVPGRGGEDGTPIATVPGGYALRIEPERVDAVRFERLAAEGRALARADPAAAAERIADALAAWHGPPFADVDELPSLVPEIRRLEELRLRAIEDRLDAELACGHHAAVVPELEALVGREPLREGLRERLMLALYRSGRQVDALAVYHEGRRRLAEELGIDPSPELQRLEAAILRQDPALDAPGALAGTTLAGATAAGAGPAGIAGATTRPRNPYKGLRPFGEADAADFHGREALVERLVRRLDRVSRSGRLLAVVGPSGSGKSSVVRAGLIAALRAGAIPGSERWRIVTVYPGAHPFEELAAALVAARPGTADPVLGRPDLASRLSDEPGALALAARAAAGDAERLVLVVDQLEELYLLVRERDVRAAYLGRLAEALDDPGSRLLVVVALRADLFDRPLSQPGFGELVQAGTEAVTPLTHDELEQAIVRPAADAAIELEPGLAEEIVADVLGRTAGLPLLQYALTELVETGDGRHVTREAYRRIGGIAGALGRRAEEVFVGLDDGDRAAARQLLLRLVAIESTGATTVRRAPLDEIRTLGGSRERIDRVLEAFGDARLVAFDHDAPGGVATVEVAHEALVTRWPRLRAWIRDEREALIIRRHLAEEAAEWDRAGRDAAFVLAEARLDRFEAWAAGTDLDLDELERTFLDASRAEWRRRDEEAASRSRREHRLRRVGVVLAGALAGVVVLAVALGALVARQNETAVQDREVAEARELAAASIGSLRTDPGLALLLAIESARPTVGRGYVSLETLNALDWALQDSHVAYPVDGGPTRLAIGPAGVRGAYVLPPEDLIALAVEHLGGAGRWWTAAECKAWGRDPCPVAPPAVGGIPLRVRLAGTVLEPAALAERGGSIAAGAMPMVEMAWETEVDPAPFGDVAPPGVLPGWTTAASGSQLDDRIAAGLPPDVAIVSGLGRVRELARRGELIDLSAMLDVEAAQAGIAAALTDPGLVASPASIDGASGWFAIPVGASVSGLVWYRPDEFARAGYTVPGTWDELIALSDRIVADGGVPWCLGATGYGAGEAVEGPADWLEELALRSGFPGTLSGPAAYDAWASERPGWDATGREARRATLVEAFRRYGEIALRDGYVLGGRDSMLKTPHELAGLPLLGDRPACWMTMATGPEGARLAARDEGTELAAFPLPGDDPASDRHLRGRVYYLVAFRDRPEVRRILATLVDPSTAPTLARMGVAHGWLPVRPVELDAGAPAAVRIQAEGLREAIAIGAFHLDASDRMAPAVGEELLPDLAIRYLRSGPAGRTDLAGQLADELELARTGS